MTKYAFACSLRNHFLPARKVTWWGRAFILLFMLLAVAVAPLVGRFSGLFHYLQSALAYLVPPVVVVYVGGVLWQRATPRAAFYTLLGGHLFSLSLFVAALFGGLTLHFTLVAGLLALLSTVLFVGLSLLSSDYQRSVIDPRLLYRCCNQTSSCDLAPVNRY